MTKPATSPTVAVRALVPVAQYLHANYPGQRDNLLAEFGLDPGMLTDADRRVRGWVLPELLERSADHTGDPHFGLHVAETMPQRPQNQDIFGYLLMTSPTWGEALRRAFDYLRLMTDLHHYEIEEDSNTAVITLCDSVPFPTAFPQLKEYVLAINWLHPRHWVEGSWQPSFVTFRHEAPPTIEEHCRIFGTEPSFGRSRDAIGLPIEILDAPLKKGDRGLSATLERLASQLLVDVPAVDDFLARVRRCIWNSIKARDQSQSSVARQLSMSSRTLQRRLQEHHTTYQELLDSVRTDLAKWMIEKDNSSASEVAFVLGFSEPAPFFRAFKRWTGSTPEEYRKRIAREPGDT